MSARARQNLLKISDDPEIMARYVIPNLSHYTWNNVDDETIKQVKIYGDLLMDKTPIEIWFSRISYAVIIIFMFFLLMVLISS